MRFRHARWTWFLLGVSFAPASAIEEIGPSGVPVRRGYRSAFAIVVGIETNGTVPSAPRPYARADAYAIHQRMLASDGLGAPREQTWLLTDRPDERPGARLASADNLREALRAVADRAGPDDLLVFFFKGSALPEEQEARWLGATADSASFARTSLLGDELRDLFAEIKCHWVLAFVDLAVAPFAGANPTSGRASPESLADGSRIFGVLSGSGRVVIGADGAGKGGPVDERRGQGRFTDALMRAWSGDAADTDGGEPDGWVTAAELWTYLERSFPAPRSDPGTSPTKWAVTRVPPLRIGVNRAVWPKIENQAALLARLESAGQIDGERRIEGTRLLAAMPRDQAARGLRKAYVELAAGAISVDDLTKVRTEALAARGVDPEIARRFADALIEARQLIDERYVLPGKGADAIAAGVHRLFREEVEEVPPVIETVLESAASANPEAFANALLQARMVLGTSEPEPESDAIDQALGTALRSLDPYSRHVPREELGNDRRAVDGHFAGLGLQVRYDEGNRLFTVVTPLFGSPAFEAGVRAGDRILEIDGKDLRSLSRDEAMAMLVGAPGRSTRLTFDHGGHPAHGSRFTKEMRFTDVKVQTVLGYRRRVDYTWDHWLDRDSRIAYARLASFDGQTADDLRRVMGQLRRDGMLAGLVLDLRFNGGGVLTSAIDVAGMFVKGTIVTIQQRDGKKDERRGRDFFPFDDFPMVVLVNRGSASGSEIVAAALADHRRAVVVGDRTFGKGSVQDIVETRRSEGALRLTTAFFTRPNGQKLHRGPDDKPSDPWGVVPEPENRVVLLPEEERRLARDLRARELIQAGDPTPPPAPDPQLQRALDIFATKGSRAVESVRGVPSRGLERRSD